MLTVSALASTSSTLPSALLPTLAAAGLSDGTTFRQLDDFLYFTGLELPDSVLAIEAPAGRTTLFVPRRDARFDSPSRRNDFPGRPLADDPALAKKLEELMAGVNRPLQL